MKGFRERLRETILGYQSRASGRTDLLQRSSKPVLVIYLILSVLFFAAYHLGLIMGAYVGEIEFVYLVVLISLGLVLVGHQITVYGKWYAVFFIGLLIVMTLLIFLFTPRYLLT